MKKGLNDVDLKNKKVIIRCDFNVPIKDGVITDDNRIIESIKTIKYVLSKNTKVILMSHLGRIKEEADKKKNSLKPVSKRLSELLGLDVKFINETRGDVLENAVNNMEYGDVILIENTRYEDYPKKLESSNDVTLAKYWASLADIFVNDAFGTLHRAHASNVGISKFLPSCVGFLVEKELKELSILLNDIKRPYVVILGGAKMNDKIGIIDSLIEKCDYILLGGGIANTFLTAKGYNLKNSIYDEESIDHCKDLIKKYSDKIVLPVDGYASLDYKDGLKVDYYFLDDVKDGNMILDIGPKSIELFSKYLNNSKTVFWNGPVGVSEFKNFEYGTKTLCETLIKTEADVIVGGGDSAAFVIKFGYKNKFKHVSTGGGASLEYIEGKKLPGLESINDK